MALPAIAGANETVLSTVLPFTFAGKLILVEATANGQKGAFILDTGASGLVMNKKYFRGRIDRELDAVGISESETALQSCWIDFELGELSWKKQNAILLSLEYLEQSKGVAVLGLLGSHLFLKHELVLDFQNKELHIKRLKRREVFTLARAAQVPPTEILPFKTKGGMPWIEVEVSGYTFRLGLDTGAESNLMRERNRRDLLHKLTGEKQMYFRGVGRKVKRVQAGNLRSVRIGRLECQPMETLFADLDYINHNLPGSHLDGILGYEFIHQFKVAINFRDRNISLWEYPGKTRRNPGPRQVVNLNNECS